MGKHDDDKPEPGDPVDAIGHALVLLARRHRAVTALALQEVKLFPGQDQVLKLLAVEDGRSMGDLATAMHIRPPTASKMIARMTAQGLVERRARPGDARMVGVHLTALGRERAARLDDIARTVEDKLLADMDDKDIKRLRKLLKRAAKNLKDGENVLVADELAEADAG
jgi:DNA-binding MarR family transcriptional regulator